MNKNINSIIHGRFQAFLLQTVLPALCLIVTLLFGLLFAPATIASSAEKAVARQYTMAPAAPKRQSIMDESKKSFGCVSCHTTTDRHTMHSNPAVVIGCTDCHGGDASVMKPEGADYKDGKGSASYQAAMEKSHILPRYPSQWKTPSSANPEQSYTLLNREAKEFVRFINPGDLRIAREACGACHLEVIQQVERSLMSTSAMFWGGASYNNGILPYKRYILGESYTKDGVAAMIKNPVPVTPHMTAMGILPSLAPLPAWETVPPGDVFRVFERGGRVINTQFPEVGLPNVTGLLQRLDEPGRPDIKQSNRGPGTGQRIAVPLINIAKTRLNDPHLWFLGTNEQPGDYRSSGCTACHTIYANDRDPKHSGPYAKFGNEGKSQTSDPTIDKTKSGSPLRHEFTRAIPSSQCMVCHMHQPNVFVNTFYGTTMWDYESDAPNMWPKKQKYPTSAEERAILNRNPEAAATRGLWGDKDFLKRVWENNDKMKDTQFADYHGHGWNFRYVFKRDRKGTLLDKDNAPVSDTDPKKFEKAVHLTSIHLDKGMHCVDCHFSQDVHGNGHVYGEVAAAVEIDCVDCHGTADKYPNMRTSGPAASQQGRDLLLMTTPDGRKRFEWLNGELYQRSNIDPKLEWKMTLTKNSVTPGHGKYSEKAARAKLMYTGEKGRDGNWGPGKAQPDYAHSNEKMTCYACHLSWTTSCAGCHLPIQANQKSDKLHYEGGETRNYATYNPQVARDDMFQLGRHGDVKGHRIAPIRSTSALILSSTNANRERIYIQQPPIASSGHSSQAFAPHYPHTERKTETKTCTDCHASEEGDNNAIMAQLLLHGTNYVNFVGFNAWVGSTKHVEAVQVTEWDEPQAVIGSFLHKYAYPDYFANHNQADKKLKELHSHTTNGEARCLQLRGEYLFVAEGRGGFRVYDTASVANKGISQRIITSPFSPLGHNTHVASKNATCMALPTNQPIAPLRNQGDLMRITNQEQPFHPIYHYAFIVDAEEGLIVVNVDTLADGEPRNNFLSRAVTWNDKDILKGARHITLGGYYAYVATDKGLVVLDLNDPLKPVVAATLPLNDMRASAMQFRYLLATTAEGLAVIDVTHPNKPVFKTTFAIADARRVYLARTFAYVAAGAEGLMIVDIEKPETPRLYKRFTADGKINDAQDVIVASTNASLYAYIADGKNGLKVVQLTSPDSQPKFYGFSPDPKPELIAWRNTDSPALALSKGLDRDRAVDETGGQIAVFGRIGSRPFNQQERNKLFLNPEGKLWTVTDAIDRAKFVSVDKIKSSVARENNQIGKNEVTK